jgi:uncharacterized membrane protein
MKKTGGRFATTLMPVDRSRLESFSDGVFAVAITLLALNLSVGGHGSLLRQLGHHWPAFVAYLISFFTIGVIWVNHHALVSNIAVIERSLLFLNLLLLAIVVTIPFVTETMATYLTAAGQNGHVGMALYAGTFEAMGLAFTALFEWTLREDARLHRPVPAAARWRARTRFYAGQVPYILAIGIAFISPYAALAITALVAVYYIFERTPAIPDLPEDTE